MKKKIWRSAALCLVAFIMAFQFGIPALAADISYDNVASDSPWYKGTIQCLDLARAAQQ